MRTLALLFVFAFASTAHAVPLLLQQQGRLLDATDQPLTGSRSVIFSLHDDDTMGNLLWTETIDVTFTAGYFSVTLGQTNPIDEGVLASPELWLSLTIASEELLPRQLVVSVPYAVMAGTAENLVGGVVDATSISVGGTPVVDDTGAWVGPPPLDTLSALSCDAGDVPQKGGSGWLCVPGTSLGTRLSEAEVEGYVTDGPLDLAAGTTLGGQTVSLGEHTQPVTSVDGLTGGTLSGAVSITSGDLTLAGGELIGLRAENTTSPVACDTGTAGQIYFDTVLGAFYGCDGTRYRLFAFSECWLGTCAENPATTCRAIRDAWPAWADGPYWITAGSATPYLAYCNFTQAGGGWTKLASIGWRNFFGTTTWEAFDTANPAAAMYSILGRRTGFQDGDGCYTFLLQVGNTGTWLDVPAHYTAWKQCHDPFTQTTAGADYTFISGEASTTCAGFNGLHNKYRGYSYATDCDLNDSAGCWWMQIVPHTEYTSAGYAEGYGGSNNYHTWQVLWVR